MSAWECTMPASLWTALLGLTSDLIDMPCRCAPPGTSGPQRPDVVKKVPLDWPLMLFHCLTAHKAVHALRAALTDVRGA